MTTNLQGVNILTNRKELYLAFTEWQKNKQGLRFGQYLCNRFYKKELPGLFNEENPHKAFVMAAEYIEGTNPLSAEM